MRSAALLVLVLGGCSLVLDDPLAFQGKVLDAGPDGAVVDATPDAPDPDAGLRDAWIPPDRYVPPPDAAPTDGPGPDAPVDAGVVTDGPRADGCVGREEVCNGEDDDCDGETDESYPERCELCGDAAGQGICGIGAFVCVGGELSCQAWLPDPGSTVACDVQDNDCDGVADEAGEAVRVRTPLEQAVVDACGPRPGVALPAPQGDCDHDDPRTVGCGGPHPCVPPGCSQNCQDDRAGGLAACAQECPGLVGLQAQAQCWGRCRAAVFNAYRDCMNRCAEVEQDASRWSCTGGDGGPVCAALDCPQGTRPAGLGCEPDIEICNNGVDDDGDGLVDGTLAGDDPCMVAFDQGDRALQQGACSDAGLVGCEDSNRVRAGSSISDSTCAGGPCPRLVTLSYPYALDAEEVSIRAYAECVASGCCLPPSGRTWTLAEEMMEAGAPPRPAAPDRCADPVRALEGDARLLDLPVTGVTWCQARDYCAWVGKRLATEYEWERAGSGFGEERRTYAWGNEEPARCHVDQCCRAGDYEGPQPGVCDGGLPVCSDDPPDQTRLACLSVYNFDEPLCPTFPGAAPVYGNQDGSTAEGLRNMTGNVAEWVFDWDGAYWTVDAEDPAGPACDNGTFPNKRMTRGQAFTSTEERLALVDRNPLFDSARAPFLGFRCARTLTGAALCDPGMPEVPAACRPGADARIDREGALPAAACPAPDFVESSALERTTCGGLAGGRRGSSSCVSGLTDFCASDPIRGGCGSFIFSRLHLPPVAIQDAEITGILNSVLESDLAPGGGSTLFALSLPPDFGVDVGREWAGAIGSAEIAGDGGLAWLGEFEAGVCGRPQTMEFNVRSVAGSRALRPVCRATGSQARLTFRSAPISLAFSAFGLQAEYEPGADVLTGTVALVASIADLRASRFGELREGDGDLEARFQQLGLNAQNLCSQPIPFLGLECFQQPLILDGCDGEVCEDPDACMGYMLPFEFEAIRATRAGVLGLACAE